MGKVTCQVSAEHLWRKQQPRTYPDFTEEWVANVTSYSHGSIVWITSFTFYELKHKKNPLH